jgi:hypothetical protein
MNLEDSVTEEERWRPLGAQCQVHCTPLIQASARMAADRLDVSRERGDDVCTRCRDLCNIISQINFQIA